MAANPTNYNLYLQFIIKIHHMQAYFISILSAKRAFREIGKPPENADFVEQSPYTIEQVQLPRIIQR